MDATSHLNRRQMLVGAASLGVVGATGLGLLRAGPAAAVPSGIGSPRSISATAAGTSTLTLSSSDFSTSSGLRRFLDLTTGGFYTGTSDQLRAAVHLPTGSVIKEMSAWGINSSATNLQVSLNQSKLDGSFDFNAADILIAPGSLRGTQQNSFSPVNTRIEGDDYLFVYVSTDGGASQQICSVRISYSPAPTYVPITPARVYDSRKTVFTTNGPLAPKTSRVISVKDGRNDAGAVNAADVVPVGATAVTYNLTVTGTTGPNFLAVGPGDVASVIASAINFPGGDDRANGGVVKLDPTRQIKVFNGDQSGSTNFIIDITGYYF